MGLCRSRHHIRETDWSCWYAKLHSTIRVDADACPAQLQKFEDSAPESLEFERLKEHFDPYLRASPSTSSHGLSHTHSTHINPITAAASSALARDIPGVARYTPHALSRSRSGRDKHANRHEVPDYRARVEVGSTGFMLGGGSEPDVEFLRHLETVEEVATLEQRWGNSWVTSPRSECVHSHYICWG